MNFLVRFFVGKAFDGLGFYVLNKKRNNDMFLFLCDTGSLFSENMPLKISCSLSFAMLIELAVILDDISVII